MGKTVILPIMNREIPIVADDYVEMDFGTGCVKMTPAHDPNDFEVGLRHNLEVIRVLDDDGVVNANGGPYEGMDRYECRKKAIVADLEDHGPAGEGGGLLPQRGHLLPLPQRRGAHYLRPVVCQDGAPGSGGHARWSRTARSNSSPSGSPRPICNWMENVHDWCISRQLWWGHQIPVWYCDDCGKMTVHPGGPGACASSAAAPTSHRDPDVLDTWFSSALWPFSTLGWPEQDRGPGLLLSHRRAGHRL